MFLKIARLKHRMRPFFWTYRRTNVPKYRNFFEPMKRNKKEYLVFRERLKGVLRRVKRRGGGENRKKKRERAGQACRAETGRKEVRGRSFDRPTDRIRVFNRVNRLLEGN